MSQEDIVQHWVFIRKGLEIVRAKARANWIPEDIYKMLREKSCGLFLCEDEERMIGYVIVSIDARFDCKSAFVWALYADDGWMLDGWEGLFEDFKELMRGYGCRRIEMVSSRAWEKRAKDFGFERKEVIYECDI